MPLNISEVVYTKIACHAAKYPCKDVCGLLLGSEENGLVNAVPLSHLPMNSCFLHSALDVLTRVLTKFPGLKIIGFYDFEETFAKEEPNMALQKAILTSVMTLSKIKKSFYVRIVSNRVSRQAENLQEMTLTEALGEFEKIDYRLQFLFYSFDSNFARISENEISGAFNFGKFEQLFRDGAHLKLLDFDEHLDDPSKDFFNKHLDK